MIHLTPSDIPEELDLAIFHELDFEDRRSCLLTCTIWNRVVRDSILWPLPEIAFGREKWKKTWGLEVGDEPPLPRSIYKILSAQSRRFPDKKVAEVARLCLMPATVDGEPFDLPTFIQIVRDKNQIEIRCKDIALDKESVPRRSYWILISKYLLEGSRDKSFEEQLDIIHEVPGREVPRVLEVAVSVLSEFAETGVRLLNEDPWSYARSEDKALSGGRQAVFGGFVEGRVHINDVPSFDDESEGVLDVMRIECANLD